MTVGFNNSNLNMFGSFWKGSSVANLAKSFNSSVQATESGNIQTAKANSSIKDEYVPTASKSDENAANALDEFIASSGGQPTEHDSNGVASELLSIDGNSKMVTISDPSGLSARFPNAGDIAATLAGMNKAEIFFKDDANLPADERREVNMKQMSAEGLLGRPANDGIYHQPKGLDEN